MLNVLVGGSIPRNDRHITELLGSRVRVSRPVIEGNIIPRHPPDRIVIMFDLAGACTMCRISNLNSGPALGNSHQRVQEYASTRPHPPIH